EPRLAVRRLFGGRLLHCPVPPKYLGREMNTRTVSRAALAVVGAAGLSASLAACAQVASVEVGSCVNSRDLKGEVTEIPTAECTEQHDAQVFHKFDLEDGDFPGQEKVDSMAEEGCAAKFEGFVGTPLEESDLGVSYMPPNENTWTQADDREVLCFVVTRDGSTVTESFEGSGL